MQFYAVSLYRIQLKRRIDTLQLQTAVGYSNYYYLYSLFSFVLSFKSHCACSVCSLLSNSNDKLLYDLSQRTKISLHLEIELVQLVGRTDPVHQPSAELSSLFHPMTSLHQERSRSVDEDTRANRCSRNNAADVSLSSISASGSVSRR